MMLANQVMNYQLSKQLRINLNSTWFGENVLIINYNGRQDTILFFKLTLTLTKVGVFYSNFRVKILIISSLNFIFKMNILKNYYKNLLNHHSLAKIINQNLIL